MTNFKKSALLAAVVLFMSFTAAYAAEGEYRFKVHNNTKHKITQILVSEDGETWGKFDIGHGIPAGETVELVWDKSTNSESCHQHFKAVFSDDSESAPTKFDFCEEDLVLEFN
jgi:hypothetical protein